MCGDMRNKKDVNITIKEVEEKYLSLVDTINLFTAKKAQTPINKDQLKKFPFHVEIKIAEGLCVLRRSDRFRDKPLLSYDTYMDEGAEFGEHFHNDIIESTEVIKGQLYDKYNNKYYNVGEVAHYEKGEKHTPIATMPTVLHVLFKE